MKKATIIIADNDNAMCSILSHAVRQRGYNVITTDNYTSLIKWVQSGKGDVVVTDLMMPGGNGLDTLSQIKKIHSNLPVIVISGQNTLMAAVRANELGAFDFMAKPFDIEVLLNCVEKALYTEIANAEMQQCDVAEDTQENLPLIGSCQAMQEIYKTVARLVPVDLSVMINGESGTGKELIARAIHGLGKRKEYPFVAVNMAAIPKELVESELFGHEKGAFTGAQNRKAGKFEQAEGGTLFLDEIGDMPADAQTKLLRVLQQGEFTPVGSNKSIKANVRIICATHRSLDEMIQEGKFREDLYYRLNVVPLRVPALRERRDDIAELTQHFLQKAVEQGLPQKAMTEEAITALKRYDWPGNIRELENLIYRICALYTESLINEHVIANELSNQELQEEETAEESVNLQMMLKRHLENYFHQCGAEDASSSAGLYSDVIKLVERPLIETTLVMTRGNQLKASKILGLNRNTLRKKMHDLSIGSKQSKLVAQAGK